MINSYYGSYRNRKFSDIYQSAEIFLADVKENPLYNPIIPDNRIKELYYILYANYGNSTIASSDENQFKYKLYMILYDKGIIWSKRRDTILLLLGLSEEELKESGISWSNFAENPMNLADGEIGTDKFLDYIQNQNVQKNEKSKLMAYADYIKILSLANNANADIIQAFKKLFLYVVSPERPLWYCEEEEETNE